MFNRLSAGFVIIASAGTLLAVACSDDESTTTATTTTTTTTTQSECEVACTELYTCGTTECPDWTAGDPTLDQFLNGEANDGCLAGCADTPALIGIIDPDDCAGTVGSLSALNPNFDASCNGAGTGGAGGGGTGGAGGGAACASCNELVINNLPPTDACAGTSTTLIEALVPCLCTECGATDVDPCYDACTTGAQPDAACLACDQTASEDACSTEWDACMTDGCVTCSEVATGGLPIPAACPGTSLNLMMELVTCLCTECGAAEGEPCYAACFENAVPDDACNTCNETAAGAACSTAFGACIADS